MVGIAIGVDAVYDLLGEPLVVFNVFVKGVATACFGLRRKATLTRPPTISSTTNPTPRLESIGSIPD